MIVGAVPLNEGTVVVLSQRQQRLDRISIRRRIVTHNRLDRQREQSLRQQQARDRNREQRRSLRAELTTEQLELRRQGEREARATSTPERLAVRQQQVRNQNRSSRADLTPEQLMLPHHSHVPPAPPKARAKPFSLTVRLFTMWCDFPV